MFLLFPEKLYFGLDTMFLKHAMQLPIEYSLEKADSQT